MNIDHELLKINIKSALRDIFPHLYVKVLLNIKIVEYIILHLKF